MSERQMVRNVVSVMLLIVVLCEKSSQLIKIGSGKIAGNVDFPFMVSIQYRPQDSGEFYHFCGGSIISQQFILTAAHCFYSKGSLISQERLRIVYGGGNLNANDLLETTISEVIIHPNFTLETNRNDIAILKTRNRFDNSTTRSALIESQAIPTKLKMIAIGWGFYNEKQENFSTYLRRARIPLTPLINCNGMGLRASAPSQLCAGEGLGADACIGDSGGPLFRFEGDLDFALVGIISYGKDVKCGAMNTLTVYTNISHYNSFIRNYVENVGISSFDPNANYGRALLNQSHSMICTWLLIIHSLILFTSSCLI